MGPAESLELNAGDAVLIVQLRAMGDMLLTTPLLRQFKRTYPDVHLDVLAEPLPARILSHNPNLRRVHVAPPRGSSPFDYLPILKSIRRERYRLAVDLISTPGSALLTRLSGAAERIGYRLRGRSWAYTRPVNRRSRPIYNPLSKFNMTRELGIEPEGMKLDIFIGAEEEAAADEIWNRPGLNRRDLVVGLAPWSKRPWRRWNFDGWISLIRRLSNELKVTYLLFATEGEREDLLPVEKASGLEVYWAGATDILQTASLIRRCRTMLTLDNGLKHIAVAMGVPTLTIYTGSDPRVWNPPDDPRHMYIVLESIRSKVQIDKAIDIIRNLLRVTATR